MNEDRRPLPKDWKPYPKLWTSLSNAVANLAVAGAVDPPGEGLNMLCEGEWIATGHLTVSIWAGSAFSTEQSDTIPAERWQSLRDALARGLGDGLDQTLPTEGDLLPIFSEGRVFSFIRDVKRERAIYNWSASYFSTALLIGSEREEYFAAEHIEVACRSPLIDSIGALARPDGSTIGQLGRGGRPPATDWVEAALAMAGLYHLGDLKPATVADVLRALQDWASAKGQELPDATARPYAKRIFRTFRAWENAD